MKEILKEILDKYGLKSLLWVVVGIFILWGIAHWMSKPGEPVRVLWGLVEYTKQQANEKISTITDKKETIPTNVSEPHCEILKASSPNRIYVSQTMKDILESISGTNNLQIEENFETLYKGKWIRVRGPVSISGYADQSRINCTFEGIFGQFDMNKSEKDKIIHLPNGAIVTVEGQFDSIIPYFTGH